MNVFTTFEDITGKSKMNHFKNTLHDFFELLTSIRKQLGNQGYLIDKYIDNLLRAIEVSLSFDSDINGDYGTGSLRRVILDILNCNDDCKKHPVYKKAKEYIDEHPLPYREEETKLELYYVALINDYLEITSKKFSDDSKLAIMATMDSIESNHLFDKISTLIGGEEKMEQLNLLIGQRFVFAPAMKIFLQLQTKDLIYALTHRDIESNKTILQLWIEYND